MAVFEIANVAVDKVEVGPLLVAYQGLNFVQVTLVAGSKVVETYHTLVELEQGFEQVAADKPSNTSDEPCAWLGGKAGL